MLEKYKVKAKEKIKCDLCGAMIQRGNKKHHQATKKCKKYNDKTTGSAVMPPVKRAGVGLPAFPVESKSKLIEINLKGEYDKMTETLNPKKKSKEMKYQCGACGCTFNNLNDGKCPDCGEQLQ